MMSPQDFLQFIQTYPELIPYIQEDESLIAEIVLNPQFRQEVEHEVIAMRQEGFGNDGAYPQQQSHPQPAVMPQAPQPPQITSQAQSNSQSLVPRDPQGNWDFSQNKNVFSDEIVNRQGGEAGSVGRNPATENPWGMSQETQFTWRPQFEVRSPSGQTYHVGEEQAKTAFQHLVNGGYARPEDFDKFVRPTGRTVKHFDLENTNKIHANDQQKFQWMNEQFDRDPRAEMLRRAQQSDDYRRSQDYQRTGQQTPADTYTQRELDRLWSERDERMQRINAFTSQQQSNPVRMPSQPQQFRYENFDANGKSMGFTTGVSGQSNYMQGAHSVKAPNGKTYQTSHATNIKTQPPITTSTNLNNFRQPNQASTGVTSATANPAVNRAPQKSTPSTAGTPTKVTQRSSQANRAPQKSTPSTAGTPTKVTQRSSQANLRRAVGSIKDKLLSSLRK